VLADWVHLPNTRANTSAAESPTSCASGSTQYRRPKLALFSVLQAYIYGMNQHYTDDIRIEKRTSFQFKSSLQAPTSMHGAPQATCKGEGYVTARTRCPSRATLSDAHRRQHPRGHDASSVHRDLPDRTQRGRQACPRPRGSRRMGAYRRRRSNKHRSHSAASRDVSKRASSILFNKCIS
jgi:hypothetical protein